VSTAGARGRRTEVLLSSARPLLSSRDRGRTEPRISSAELAHQAVYERLAYTVEEAASILGVGRDLLYDEIRTGRLRSKKAGARRVIARHHLLEWLDSDWPEPDRRVS
jgi:excisionase family DNA binding protein